MVEKKKIISCSRVSTRHLAERKTWKEWLCCDYRERKREREREKREKQ